jgi:hypothetical protein
VVSSNSFLLEHRDTCIRSVSARLPLRAAASNKNISWHCCRVVLCGCGGVDIPDLPREWANALRTYRPRLCGFPVNLSIGALATDRIRISVRIGRCPSPENRTDRAPGFDRRCSVLALGRAHGVALCRGRHVVRKSSDHRAPARIINCQRQRLPSPACRGGRA